MPGIVSRNNQIVFFAGNNRTGLATQKFDIYDIPTKTWSIGALPQTENVERALIISVNNIIYVAGAPTAPGQVWKLEF